jgi:hypothetical protein
VWWIGAGSALIMMIFSGLLITQPPVSEPAGSPIRESLSLRDALSNRNIWLLALEFACFNLALVPIATYYPTFLNQERGYLWVRPHLQHTHDTVSLLRLPDGYRPDWSPRILSFLLVVAVLLIFPFRVTGWQIIAVMVAQELSSSDSNSNFAAISEVMRKLEWIGWDWPLCCSAEPWAASGTHPVWRNCWKPPSWLMVRVP